ncbi:phage tail tube protein, partial [Escherichia coli]|uniref:phage tail tube protein n=2 Tax=root TaxID=1 RepID=UPI001F238EB4
VFDGIQPLKCDTLTFTNDNGASAQFELGNNSVAFVERGRAVNTFSIAGKLYDMAMIQKFINETQVEINSILSGVKGAMSISMKRAELTAVTPEIGGAESVTQSIEGQATGNSQQSSIVIQRLVYA